MGGAFWCAHRDGGVGSHAPPRQVYGPENWLRGPESVDDL